MARDEFENVAPAPVIAAVVLAAGASSRMGRPKALLDFDGRSCLARVLAACGGSKVVLVTSPNGEAIRKEGERAADPILHVINEHPERGMLSSVQTGLRQLPPDAEAFLIFPVDYPLVPASEVRHLVAAFAARTPQQTIFVPSFAGRRGHPVLMAASLVPEILRLGEGESLRTLMAAHDAAIVHVAAADERVLLDMDTPEDYQRCLAQLRS